MVEQEWLTVQEVADRLRVHPDVVRRWLRQGKLAGKNLGGQTGWRIRWSAFERFMKEGGAIQPNPAAGRRLP